MRSLAAISLCVFSLILSAPAARGQNNAAVLGSTISGHVVCADTGAPARFARVLLKSTTPSDAGGDFMKQIENSMRKAAEKAGKPMPTPQQTDEQKRQRAAASRSMSQATDLLNASTVGMDGAYRFVGVKPGTYFVHVAYPGYVDEYTQFTDADFASSDPAIRARIAALPTVTVNGTDTANVDLRLIHGAAISGRVLYDDGKPAVGWAVWALHPGSVDTDEVVNPGIQKQVALEAGEPVTTTDDRGDFRIAGLAAGKYLLRANLFATPVGVGIGNLNQAGSGIRLAVYAPATFQLATARPVSITQGEEHAGTDITVPARTLHALVGHVYAAADNHPLNKGDVLLTSKSDPSLHGKAPIRDDGSFHFDYLPGDTTYTLSVADAADATYKSSGASFLGISASIPEVKQAYAPATQDVVLGKDDNTSIRFSLTPAAKSAEMRDAPAH